ncbi:MAG: EamA family transporter [Siculibacillus sp.]|nr:EamA family transporter [Siculibacillus sp.]
MPIGSLLLALMVVAIWGFNFVVISVGLADVPPLFLTALRFVFAAFPAVFFLRRPPVTWRLFLGFGLIFGVVKFGLLFVGMKAGMPAGLSSIVLQMQAFFTIAFAWAALGERPLPIQILGGAVAIAGIAVIGATRWQGAGLLPFALVIAAAASWGVSNILTKKAGRIDMLAFIVWISLVPILPLLALSLAFEGWEAIAATLAHPSWTAVGAVAYLAGPTTLFGYGVWSFLLSRHPAATVAPLTLLVPIFGMGSAALVLGEPFGGIEMIGAGLVFVGLVVNVLGPRVALVLRK